MAFLVEFLSISSYLIVELLGVYLETVKARKPALELTYLAGYRQEILKEIKKKIFNKIIA